MMNFTGNEACEAFEEQVIANDYYTYAVNFAIDEEGKKGRWVKEKRYQQVRRGAKQEFLIDVFKAYPSEEGVKVAVGLFMSKYCIDKSTNFEVKVNDCNHFKSQWPLDLIMTRSNVTVFVKSRNRLELPSVYTADIRKLGDN